MKNLCKKIVTGILITGICACMAACGANEKEGSQSSGKTDVRIAYFPNITHTQALVMKNKKTLEEKWKDSCIMDFF